MLRFTRVPDRGAPARAGAPRPADRRDAGGAAAQRRTSTGTAWRSTGRIARTTREASQSRSAADRWRSTSSPTPTGSPSTSPPASGGGRGLAAHPRHDARIPRRHPLRRGGPGRRDSLLPGGPALRRGPRRPARRSPRRPTRDHPDDAARSGARADGRPRPPRGGSRRRQPVVPVGSVRGRARVGHGARGLQRRRRRVVVLPARPRPFPGLPLERGRDGRAVRRVRAAVPRAGAVERPRPDPQGADVRPREQRGQPRRGRQGLLVVPRCAAVERLAALALPLPAGRVPVRRARRASIANARSSKASTSCSTRACSTPATGWSRSTTRRPTRPTS